MSEREWVKNLPLIIATCGGCGGEWKVSPLHKIGKCRVCGEFDWRNDGKPLEIASE
jgi:hypothetical protein